jgi:hypothetical protein
VLKLGGMAAAASAATLAGAATELARPGVAHASGVQWLTGSVSADEQTTVLPSNTFSGTSDVLLEVRVGSNTTAPAHPLTTGSSAAIAAYDVNVNSGLQGLYATSINGNGVVGRGDNGFGVSGITSGGTGVNGAANGGTGVVGTSNLGTGGSFMSNTSGTGVAGSSSSGTGVAGTSSTGIGASFGSGPNAAQLKLVPAGSQGAPGSGAHTKGEIYLDSAATVWVCIANGTPGTWVRLGAVASGALGGAITYLGTPIRLLDARNSSSSGLVNRTPLVPFETYPFMVAGLGGSGIPASAQGLIANVTVLGPSGAGNLLLFPSGGPGPQAASMTFGTPGLFLANGVNVGIGSGGAVNIQNQSNGTTPLVLDAVAYVS